MARFLELVLPTTGARSSPIKPICGMPRLKLENGRRDLRGTSGIAVQFKPIWYQAVIFAYGPTCGNVRRDNREGEPGSYSAWTAIGFREPIERTQGCDDGNS